MQRISEVKKTIKQKGLDGSIVTNPINIRYLTNFKGALPTDPEREAILVITKTGATLITARLYQAEAKKVASKDLKVKIVHERNQIFEEAIKLLKNVKTVGLPTETFLTSEAFAKEVVKVGFEEDNLKFSEHLLFKKALPKSKLIPIKNLIEDLRLFKSEEEIKKTERAQIISQRAFGKLLKTIKVGQTETEIAHNLERVIKDLGGRNLAFETIVAIGANSSKPHHLTSDKRLTKNDTLLIDFGARFQDYCADMTRTIFIGKPKDEQVNIYKLVEKAQKEALKYIEHGLAASSAYHAANEVFKREKVHDYFIHGLGHGIGLEVHEAPYLRPTIEDKLKESMVFSIEPGLYFPSWGGVRIEDLVTIKNGRAKVLGKLQKELIII